MTVFLLQHSYLLDSDSDVYETKILGVYSSEELATNAILRYRKLDGFKLHPDDFYIDKYEINKDDWTEGFISIEDI